ncbi:MAG TPA: chromate transporter [Verrucomicrobiae bacterium]|jgi:chromate transporter|nr:chromate transporter [Verrucomicrobiae bacterium]
MPHKVMSDVVANLVSPPNTTTTSKPDVTILQIFLEFLLIGATSFGGGVVAYLRDGLVGKRGWINDQEFVEYLAISQTLPGLNATNMAVLVGDNLRGYLGSVVALIGICLPGGLLMSAAGAAYHASGNQPMVTAMLRGVAAAAIGLILATTIKLGKKSLAHAYDLVFVALTVYGVDKLHQSVPRVLVVVGLIAIFWYRPRKTKESVS